MISLILLAIIFFALYSCTSSSPETIVREFLEAAARGNEKRMASMTVEGSLANYRGGERFLSQWNVQFRLTSQKREGALSVVLVEFQTNDKSVEVPYICRKKGGKWKVSLTETMRAWEEGV